MSGLDAIRVVLVRPESPGNIGSAARALKTMGLGELWLVAPKAFPHPDATMMAVEAGDVLGQAEVVATLDEALSGCTLTIGTSRRPRRGEANVLDVDQTVERVASASGPVALVFGPEPGGLTGEDLDRCRFRSFLPSDPDCPSLNLAQAVQVYAYALRRGIAHAPLFEAAMESLDHAGRQALGAELQRVLTDLEMPRSDLVGQRLKAMLDRCEMSVEEARSLHGLLRRIGTPPKDR